MISLVLSLIVACVSGPSRMQSQTVEIYVGREAERVIHLTGHDLGYSDNWDYLHEIAYDPPSRLLYIYVEFTDGLHVRCWTSEGKLLREWRLLRDLVAVGKLHWLDGQLCAGLWDKVRKKFVLAIFKSSTQSTVLIKDLGHPFYQPYDASLDPVRVRFVRRVMKDLNWIPVPPAGGSVIDPKTLIDSFPVNAGFLSDRIAWSTDDSILSFGYETADVVLNLAIKNAGGRYISIDIRKPIFDALQWPFPYKSADLDAVVLTPRIAVYGIGLRDHPGLHQKDVCHFVVWLDLRAEEPKVVRKETGYLACIIPHFGRRRISGGLCSFPF